MSDLPTCRRIPLLLLCAAFTTWGCAETRLVEPDPASEPEPSIVRSGVLLRCVIEADAPEMVCRAEEPDPSDDLWASIHLGTPYVALQSGFVGYNATEEKRLAEVSLTNNSGQTVGGAANPSRVWFFELPVVTGGSGEVTVDNPDGTDTFVDSEERPFFEYAEELAPGATSPEHSWVFNQPQTVTSFQFSVFVEVNLDDENAPFIGSISPSILEPGEAATISGFNFSSTPEDNQVMVDGQGAIVTAATTTELTIEVPALPAADCSVDHISVEVTVTPHPTATQAHQAVTGSPNTLAALSIGEFVNLHQTGDVACGVELPLNDGEQYFLSVHNVSTDRTVEIGLQLTGSMDGAAAAVRPSLSLTPKPQLRPLSRSQQQQLADFQAHLEQLERNHELYARLGPPLVRTSAAPSNQPPAEGTLMQFFAPRRDSTVWAEAIYSGTHVVVFEDTLSAMRGQMDAELQSMGQEYDDRMHDLLTTNYGDPLAMDASLDDNGVIYFLFVRPSVTFAPGLVSSCDFLSSCSTSNQAEIAFIRAPSSVLSSTDLTVYHRTTRPTLMHEAKHITSMAEDLSNGQPLEEVALEEATASLSEELWGWDVQGRTQFSNLQWEDEPGCFSIFGAPSGCSEPVSGTRGLFIQLYDRLGAWESNGQFGSPAWYYVYWWFVRWSVDQSGVDQGTFLKSLVSEGTLQGADNLVDKMGRSFPELLGEFTLATMVDDLAGFTPTSTSLDHPSWDLRDVFIGVKDLNETDGRTEDFPIDPTPVSSGVFAATIETLEAASTKIFELTGTTNGTQTLRLRNVDGDGPADPLIRMSIVRVQ